MTDQELIARLGKLATNMFQSGNWGEGLDTTKAAADRIEDFRNGISFALAWASRPIPNGTFEDRFEAYEQALTTIDALLYGNGGEMKLEVGKRYVLQSGQVVGPMWKDDDNYFLADQVVEGYLPVWFENGEADFFTEREGNDPNWNVVKELDESARSL